MAKPKPRGLPRRPLVTALFSIPGTTVTAQNILLATGRIVRVGFVRTTGAKTGKPIISLGNLILFKKTCDNIVFLKQASPMPAADVVPAPERGAILDNPRSLGASA
ncbi:hypothetical protein ABIB38_002523 [Massilia sp. UYP11]|uniref:hypothetical protein n=1 Tax=Massilia sp. UYP11 TaxID=1756385 RepID=UPI003D1AC65B